MWTGVNIHIAIGNVTCTNLRSKLIYSKVAACNLHSFGMPRASPTMALTDTEVHHSSSAAGVSSEEDRKLLEVYASRPLDHRESRAAVVRAASRAHGTQATHAARTALASLAADDPPYDAPDVMTALLDVAAAGANVDDVRTFVLASSAWKVVTAAALVPSPAKGIQDIAIRKQVLLTAGNAIATVVHELHRTAADRARPTSDGATSAEASATAAMARFVKIVRFHCVNAARCAARFLDQDTSLSASEKPVCTYLQNLALLLQLSVLRDEELPDSVASDLELQVLPPAAAAARAVLVMCETAGQLEQAVSTAYSVDTVSEKKLPGSLLAIAYLGCLVSAASKPNSLLDTFPTRSNSKLTGETGFQSLQAEDNQKNSSSRDWEVPRPGLEEISDFQNSTIESKQGSSEKLSQRLSDCLLTFISLLLDLICQLYPIIFQTRARTGRHLLLDIALSAVIDCAVKYDLAHSHSFDKLDWFILKNVASQNAITSWIAAEVAFRLLRSRQQCSEKQMHLFAGVMATARCSEAAGISCSDTQWMPLASRMANYLYFAKSLKKTDLFDSSLQYAATGSKDLSPPTCCMNLAISDVTALEILAQLCATTCAPRQEGHITAHDDVYSFQPTGVFQDLTISRQEISACVKSVLLGSSHGGRLACACAKLLPFVCDARTAAGAALACIKRSTSSTMLVLIALNSMNPGTMPEASLTAVAAEAPRLIQRHGPSCLPAVTAFLARSATYLHKNVSLSMWGAFAPAVNSAIHFARSQSGTNQHPIFCAAIMHHAAATLSITCSVSRTNAKTTATLPKESLSAAETALERYTSYMKDAKFGCSVSPAEQLVRAREAAMMKANQLSISAAHQQIRDTSLGSFGFALAELSRSVAIAVNKHSKSDIPPHLAAEVQALRNLTPRLSALIAFGTSQSSSGVSRTH